MKKVLFVCRQNTGRSQIAAEFYKKLGGYAESAGTKVDDAGQRLSDRAGAQVVIDAMKEEGVDMSSNVRRQVTPEMLKDFDKAVVMAEPENIPDWLGKDPKTIIWQTKDIKGLEIEAARPIRDEIKAKVEKLAEELR